MDIDTDFSGHARELSINYVKEKYGQRAVAGIMTKGTMAAKKALTYAPKLLGNELYGDIKHFNKLGAQMRSLLTKADAKLADVNEAIKNEFADNKEALRILEYANQLEGCLINYGQHAAGLIAIQKDEVEDFIPLMALKDQETKQYDTFVIQADMIEAEAQLGFIKFDFLGLKNLNTITLAMDMIKRNYGVTIDPYNLPFEEEVFKNIFSKGDTNFVFQFESDGMKRMLKDFKPTSFEDIILLVACYRPGPMQYLTDEGESVNVIKVKNGIEPAKYLIPELEPILKDTYGGLIYQEQVMRICTDLAGYTLAEADNVRKYMSKKKADKLAKERVKFVNGCKNNHIDAAKADELFDQMMDFASYAFNKSHAAAYALVSYITAWLKYNYSKEYLCAAMTEQPDKTANFIEDCKRYSIEVYRPDINNSMENYSPYEDGIIVGLSAIKGCQEGAIQVVEERDNGLYESLEDFIVRVPLRSDNLKAMILSGAFDTFISNREDAVEYALSYAPLKKKESETLKAIEDIKADESLEDKAKARKLKGKEKSLNDTQEDLKSLPKISNIPNNKANLIYESEYIGMWLSGNPLDNRDTKGYKDINKWAHQDNCKIAGVISETKKIVTKNGDNMAICTIIDKAMNSAKLVIFPQAYEEFKPLLEEGSCIGVQGTFEVEGEDSYSILANKLTTLSEKEKEVIISIKDIVDYVANVEKILKENRDDSGILVTIKNEQLKELRQVAFKVNPEALKTLKNNYCFL